ncbi:jg18185 [Pararge aegeria aegeria]|uniref:Jg18185 protein n=1 Tax=Pararge aegeria aegeria TaxID=348720 RepID=A0A8S4RDU2_9NEOP|nr:jg18185 [Pararge aegeria aegeria]
MKAVIRRSWLGLEQRCYSRSMAAGNDFVLRCPPHAAGQQQWLPEHCPRRSLRLPAFRPQPEKYLGGGRKETCT